MLDYFRQGAQSKFAKIILALITIPFALWGVESYVRNGISTDSVATVVGQKISAQDFNQALKEGLEQQRARLGGNVDPNMVDNPEFRRMVLDDLISRRLLLADAAQSGVVFSDEIVLSRIAEMLEFQVDGKFSWDRYEGLIRQAGFTPAAFKARVRQGLMLQNHQQAVAGSMLISRASVDALIRAMEQTREISVVNYMPEQFVSQVKVGEADIKAYYESHKPEFTTPDQVKLEYVALSADELASQMTVTDEEVKKYYDDHISQYQQSEERQASHILIKLEANASEADKKAALAKAEDVLKQAKSAPEKFAALAEKYSQDPGSSANGGDVGFFAKGAMVKPFSDAVYQMKKDEIQGPVQSEFGYHIIKLTGIKPGKVKSLDEVRSEITAELQKQKAGKKFAEIAEPFSNVVYEQSASLKPAADAYKLSIKQSPWITRQGAPVPALNNEKLLQAVFGDEVRKNKRNTEAVEVAPNTLVSARVVESKPSALRPLAEVSANISAKLTREQAGKLAVKQGKEQLEQISKGTMPAGVNWQNPQQISRREPGVLPPTVLDAAFKASSKNLPAYTGIDNPQGGYSLIRVSKVTDGALNDEAKRRLFVDQLKSVVAQNEFNALVSSLRESADVKVRKDILEKKVQ